MTQTTAPLKRPAPSLQQKPQRKISAALMVQVTLVLISLISIAISMAGAIVMVWQIFSGTSYGLLAQLVALGLAFGVGWIIALIGIRQYKNTILSMFIGWYRWIVLAGVSGLYIIIVVKLFEQDYSFGSFVTYALLMLAGLVAMWGINLLLADDSLVLCAVPLLVINLVHLYLMVFHYLMVPGVKDIYMWGDATFFILMGILNGLMLANMPLLNPLRRMIEAIFSEAEAPQPA
jgi:hypothetical protein